MAKTVFDVLEKGIAEQLAAAEKHLNGGACQNYAEYREVVGMIRGLNSSQTIINDLSRRYLEDDDE